MIELFELPALASELTEIRKSNIDQFPGMREFVQSLEHLIEAAIQEGNPIVFT